jgi:hypothetical protein
MKKRKKNAGLRSLRQLSLLYGERERERDGELVSVSSLCVSLKKERKDWRFAIKQRQTSSSLTL